MRSSPNLKGRSDEGLRVAYAAPLVHTRVPSPVRVPCHSAYTIAGSLLSMPTASWPTQRSRDRCGVSAGARCT